jgi:hypothetical protein
MQGEQTPRPHPLISEAMLSDSIDRLLRLQKNAPSAKRTRVLHLAGMSYAQAMEGHSSKKTSEEQRLLIEVARGLLHLTQAEIGGTSEEVSRDLRSATRSFRHISDAFSNQLPPRLQERLNQSPLRDRIQPSLAWKSPQRTRNRK